jgi:glycine dehydrogenase subunit 1
MSKEHHYLPASEEDRQLMLESMGLTSFDQLVEDVPVSLRNPQLNIQEAFTEFDLQKALKVMSGKNHSTESFLSFLGGGSYEHAIPTAVAEVARRNEFYTAYTPYQPEASQGSLQSIYEYQSLMTELTGLDVSNASHYDGATSLAEAAILALRHTDRTKILIARSVHPHYREVLATYLNGTPYSVSEFSFLEDKTFNAIELEKQLDENVAAVIFQTPNFFGLIEDLEGWSEKLHNLGILMILACNPSSLGMIKTPGEWGADIAVGEGQPLGISLQFGGPYLGIFSVTRALVRKIPGRLAGLTQDSQGRRAYCLTLQAREQHIRRERASSNICTNQALCALMACVYMTLMGKQGMKELAAINMDRAYYLRDEIAKLPSFQVNVSKPIFNEFVVKGKKSFSEIQAELLGKKILPGIALETFYPELKNEFLVCATETKNKTDLDFFVKELSKC